MGPAVLPVDGAVEAGKVAEEEEGSSGVEGLEGVEGRAELAGLQLRGAMEEQVRAMRTCVKCEEVEVVRGVLTTPATDVAVTTKRGCETAADCAGHSSTVARTRRCLGYLAPVVLLCTCG
jgi:hypothetical protein